MRLTSIHPFFFLIPLASSLGQIQPRAVARYEFNEGSGTVAVDSSGNGFNGTIAGASYVSGFSGTALRFRYGTLDRVTIPRALFGQLGNRPYFEAVIRPSQYPQTCGTGSEDVAVFRKRGSFNDWSVYMTNDGKVWSNIYNQAGTGFGVGSPTPLPLNTWTRVAAYYDGTHYRLLVNGSEVASLPVSLVIDWDRNWINAEIGNVTTDAGSPSAECDRAFPGDIDEVTIGTLDQGPPSPTCTYSVSPTSLSSGAAGGSFSLAVTAPPGCQWTASTGDSWVTVASGQSGSGNGTVSLMVAPNPGSASRTGTILAAGVNISISQGGAPCRVDISPGSASYAAAGAEGVVTVQASASDCPWSATADAPWIGFLTTPSGSGPAQLRYRVEANTAQAPRSGQIAVAGQFHRVSQAGSVCSYTLNAAVITVPASGGAGSVFLSAPSGCAFTVLNTSPFLALTGGASGSGNTEIRFQASPNPTASTRYATLAIAGQTVLVTQPGLGAVQTSCTVSSGSPAALRDLGRTELVGEVSLACDTPGAAGTLTGDVFVTLNAAVTSRILNAGSRETEAALLRSGSPPVMGRLDGPNAVRFPGVVLAQSAPPAGRSGS